MIYRGCLAGGLIDKNDSDPDGIRTQPTRQDGDMAAEPRLILMTAKHVTILLVDDEETIRSTLYDHLTDLGYQVIAANSGDSAMTFIDDDIDINLVITDIMMPGIVNGFDLIEYAQLNRPGIKSIAMSGFVGSDNRRISLADIFLAKPFTYAALERDISNPLSR
jgi:CheY-like chemotaxis protein